LTSGRVKKGLFEGKAAGSNDVSFGYDAGRNAGARHLEKMFQAHDLPAAMIGASL
jgi:hypothetical protein